MEQQHVIGKFSLEVQLPSRQDAFQLQGRLSDSCNTKLTPLLATLLDSWTDPDVLLQIDRLEIDLGTCSQEMLENDLPQLVIAYLQQRYPGMRQEDSLERGMHRVPVGEGYFESWLYFLEHGVLPHAAIRWTRLEWEAGILATLSTETKACWQCEKLLLSNPHALKRLLFQFSRPFVQNWLRAYSTSVCHPLLELVSEWETFCYHPQVLKIIESSRLPAVPVLPPRADFHLVITEWLIREAVLPGQSKEHPRLLEEVIQLLPHSSVQYWLYLLQQMPVTEMNALPLLQQAALTLAVKYNKEIIALQEELAFKPPYIAHKEGRPVVEDRNVPETPPVLPEVTADDRKEIASSSEEQQAALVNEQVEDVTAITEQQAVIVNEQVEDVVAVAVTEQKKTAPDDKKERNIKDIINKDEIPSAVQEDFSSTAVPTPDEGTVLYINNAGLILLHPYLGIFFDALGLREGRVFKDDEALNKAIQLLGYLGSGEDEIPEYDLVFPKLICGILPAQPIRRFVPLSAAEKAEADELLLSVISHWNALGSTTPDGLRGNFLMREGKLMWKEGEWQLYVSQQPYDMLLNRLPWGFSVVGLSWMPWLIKTVWT